METIQSAFLHSLGIDFFLVSLSNDPSTKTVAFLSWIAAYYSLLWINNKHKAVVSTIFNDL